MSGYSSEQQVWSMLVRFSQGKCGKVRTSKPEKLRPLNLDSWASTQEKSASISAKSESIGATSENISATLERKKVKSDCEQAGVSSRLGTKKCANRDTVAYEYFGDVGEKDGDAGEN